MDEHAGTHAGEMFGAGFWDERYRSAERVWSGNPNPQLVAEVAGRAPGLALDVGCGEGADAIWLARAGWMVVGADISGVALERAARHADDSRPGGGGADRLVAGGPARPGARAGLVRPGLGAVHAVAAGAARPRCSPRSAAAVRTGGMLLIVGHHPSDLDTGVPRPPMPELFYPPEEIAGPLGDPWTVQSSEARPRPATTPDGIEVTIHDTVLAAIRERAEAGRDGLPREGNEFRLEAENVGVLHDFPREYSWSMLSDMSVPLTLLGLQSTAQWPFTSEPKCSPAW